VTSQPVRLRQRSPEEVVLYLEDALLKLHAERGEALRLLRLALHLRMHGERAPGGDETWAQFDRECEAFLREAEPTP